MLSYANMNCLERNLNGDDTNMNELDWDSLRYFLAAARTGSLTAAGRLLGSNQPTVGRRIDALEVQLGVCVFQRHSGGLTLTEEGRRLLEVATAMETQAANALRCVQTNQEIPSGMVRIAAPEGMGVLLLAPALPRLHQDYPELEIVIEPSSAYADLKRGQADVALRFSRPVEADMVSRQVCEVGFGLYAAQDYLNRNGVPTTVEELRGHHVIAYGEALKEQPENLWLMEKAGGAVCRVRSDNTLARLMALMSGNGIGVMPHLLMHGQPGCVRVLPSQEAPGHMLWLAVHGDLRHVPRVRVVMDFMYELLQEADSLISRKN